MQVSDLEKSLANQEGDFDEFCSDHTAKWALTVAATKLTHAKVAQPAMRHVEALMAEDLLQVSICPMPVGAHFAVRRTCALP